VELRVTGEAAAMGYCHCSSCRSWSAGLVNAFTLWKLVDVCAATIPGLPFKPALHVNYQESVLRIRDGLPKMKDLPNEMGGSGETLPDQLVRLVPVVPDTHLHDERDVEFRD
jgi:hypothetical protein